MYRFKQMWKFDKLSSVLIVVNVLFIVYNLFTGFWPGIICNSVAAVFLLVVCYKYVNYPALPPKE